jgi:hypothetical protein
MFWFVAQPNKGCVLAAPLFKQSEARQEKETWRVGTRAVTRPQELRTDKRNQHNHIFATLRHLQETISKINDHRSALLQYRRVRTTPCGKFAMTGNRIWAWFLVALISLFRDLVGWA